MAFGAAAAFGAADAAEGELEFVVEDDEFGGAPEGGGKGVQVVLVGFEERGAGDVHEGGGDVGF